MAGPKSRGRTDDAEDAGHLDLERTRELFEAFVAERLAPALKDAGRPQPNFEFWTVERVDVMA